MGTIRLDKLEARKYGRGRRRARMVIVRAADNDACHFSICRIRWGEVKCGDRLFLTSAVARRACHLYRKALSHVGGDVHESKPVLDLFVVTCNRRHNHTTRPTRHFARARLFISLFLALDSLHQSIHPSTPRVSSCHDSPRHGILSNRSRPHLTPPQCRSPSATSTRSTTYISHAANAYLPLDL